MCHAGLLRWAAGLTLALGPLPRAAAQDRPVAPGRDQELEALTGEAERPLQITGFGVGGYHFDARSRANTFQAGKVALSAFRELDEHLWLFAQLTTALSSGGEGEAGAEGHGGVATETEIDNLLLNVTLPGASNVNFSLGKLDAPVGFERDDEPLNLLSSTSYNFELARPAKLVGLVGRWSPSPRVGLTGIVANGWNSDLDPNRGKTAAIRLGVLPDASSSLGLSGMVGVEGDEAESHGRYLVDLDYAFQPVPSLILAGEANYGGDRGVLADGSDATWKGATLILFGRLRRQLGLALRAEVFDDPDGARTGTPQTLQSYTLGPVLFVGTGREGIFANVEHTTFRIPRFQLRGEVRLDRSSQPVFETGGGLGTWGLGFGLQLVAVF